MSEQALLNELPDAIAQAEELPSPPTVASEVVVLTGREDATIERLAEVISHDPALSAKILKLANSAIFRRGAEITSLEAAAMRLGMKTLRLMALSFSLVEGMPRDGKRGGFDYGAYWKRSLTFAVAGRSLARLLKSARGDEAFVCGLLGRLGQSVMARCIAADYARVLSSAQGSLPTAALEREMLGYDFHQVGGALLRAWSLPGLICDTIRWYDDPETAPEVPDPVRELIRIMNVADLMSDVICGWDKGTALRRAHEAAEHRFGIVDDELDQCIVNMEQDVADAAGLLRMDVDAESYQRILEQARVQMMRISLGTAIEFERTAARAEELEKENKELEGLAETDPLTGLPNRGHFDRVLRGIVDARLKAESGRALGLLVLDVDHFKRFNDTYGHLVGDEVLRQVAASLEAGVRATDLAARYGGEEFVVILPNTTPQELHAVAERLRQRIGEASLEHEGAALRITVSVGGACVRRLLGPDDGRALIALADACLYRAKDTGRNRTVCAEFETVDEDG